MHIRYQRRVETRDVKGGKFVTVAEHKAHICNICSTESRNVERSKVHTIVKHTVHRYDFFGVEARNVECCK